MADHKGKVIFIDDNTICVSRDDGSHHARSFTSATTVTIGGKKAAIGDLKAGDVVTVAGDPVTSIVIAKEPGGA